MEIPDLTGKTEEEINQIKEGLEATGNYFFRKGPDGNFVPSYNLITTEHRTRRIKALRVILDGQLQLVKEYQHALSGGVQKNETGNFADEGQAIHQCELKLKETIMWLGMTLKGLGNPNPYPNSYNPANTIVDKTADGLKL